jgi:hypothetical protein
MANHFCEGKLMTEPEDLAARITDYLSNGGFFNPEMMDHEAVRDLMVDCRDYLAATREPTIPEGRCTDKPMSLRVALDFADNPRTKNTMQAPADSTAELREALRVLAEAYRAASSRAQDTLSLLADLAALVRVKYGNLDSDVNRMLAHADRILAAPIPAIPAKGRVYLVATGETHEGRETYTRHDGKPPALCDSECLYTSPAIPAEGQAWRDAFSKISHALAAIVNVSTPDKLFDLDAIPRDPVMAQVTTIRSAIDAYGKTLLAAPIPASQPEEPHQ